MLRPCCAQSTLSSDREDDSPSPRKSRGGSALSFWRRVRPTGGDARAQRLGSAGSGGGGGGGSGGGGVRSRSDLGVDLGEVDSLMTKIAEQQVRCGAPDRVYGLGHPLGRVSRGCWTVRWRSVTALSQRKAARYGRKPCLQAWRGRLTAAARVCAQGPRRPRQGMTRLRALRQVHSAYEQHAATDDLSGFMAALGFDAYAPPPAGGAPAALAAARAATARSAQPYRSAWDRELAAAAHRLLLSWPAA